jgi:RND family efflux transporter MFP subunit
MSVSSSRKVAVLTSLIVSLTAEAGEFDCVIQPAQMIEIRSPVTGLLQTVHVRRGAPIRKGQVLVTIESGVERSAVDTARFKAEAQGAQLVAQKKLDAARDKSRRQDELFEENFVSAQARDDARADLRLAEAELQSAQESNRLAKFEYEESLKQLQRRQIRSTVNGVVVDQYLHPGSIVDSGDSRKPILKIAETDLLYVEANLPLRYFKQINPGMTARIRPEPPFSETLSVKVKTVDKIVDAAAGTFGVVAELKNHKQEVPAGIRCKMLIDVAK